MEFVEQQALNQQKNCKDCRKKHQLIQKYENLITLLKKKADRSQLSQLSVSKASNNNKLSIIDDRTTSNTSFNGNNTTSKYVLPILLNKLKQNINTLVFHHIRSQSYIKKYKTGLQFIQKVNHVCLHKQKEYINQMKQQSHQGQVQNQNILCSESIMENQLIVPQQTINKTAYKEFEKQQNYQNSPQNKKSACSYSNQAQNYLTLCNLNYISTPLNPPNQLNTNYKSLTLVHEDLITSMNYSGIGLGARTVKQQSLQKLFFKKQNSTAQQQMKNLYNKLFVLQQQNFAYQQKIKNLQFSMQQALNRQIKQNRKKTQSLQMVAQQMSQKNELITELQQQITMLEQRYGYETNGVLEDQLTQHRKEVDKLEKVNIRLDNQLRKARERLVEVEAGARQLEQENAKKAEQVLQVKLKLFEMEQKTRLNQLTNEKFKRSCFKIQKILEKLKYCEKNLKILKPKSTQKQLSEKQIFCKTNKNQKDAKQQIQVDKKYSQLEQFYKLELVFICLYNIEDQNYEFNEHSHQFDQQQLQVLKQLKNKIKDMRNKIQKLELMQTIYGSGFGIKQTKVKYAQGRLSNCNLNGDQCDQVYAVNSQENFKVNGSNNNAVNGNNDNNGNNNEYYQDGIYCHQNMVDGSIFEVLNQQRNHNNSRIDRLCSEPVQKSSQVSQIGQIGRTERVQPEKNLTMKLLQMQIEKNKQIQKISELKQKNMYVRNIILNLIKSMQLKQNGLKIETTGILNLIFDVFEYSEQEKEIIFAHGNQVKEKKFFGFI